MPELPEVAALSTFLDTRLRGAVLEKLQILSVAVLKTADPPYTSLTGRTITGVERFGKFVSIDADGLHFVFHLARAGWVRFTEKPSPDPLRPGKGPIAARLHFAGADGGKMGIDLTEAGTKKGLAVYVVRDPNDVPGVAALGPDPLAEDFTPAALGEIVKGRRTQIKGLLRDQKVIAGIGNAYSDEVLHVAKMSPFKIASSLTEEDIAVVHDAIVTTLRDAVKRSSGLAAGDLKAEKKLGLRVHGRAGQKCPVCGDTVREVSFADSALQYCPTCQTGGKPLADRRLSRLLK
jgi:formamidopyrimidine-DNA glycosylase